MPAQPSSYAVSPDGTVRLLLDSLSKSREGMPTRAYNLLWLTPRFALPGESFRQPIPERTFANMRAIAQRNPGTDVRLWIDSRRMSDTQMEWLRRMTAESPSGNLQLLDLRAIPEYDTVLFNQHEAVPNLGDRHSLIWRQVDAAKLLVCLQGDYDEQFYSDADWTIQTDSMEV